MARHILAVDSPRLFRKGLCITAILQPTNQHVIPPRNHKDSATGAHRFLVQIKLTACIRSICSDD